MADDKHNLDTWPHVLRTLAELIGPELTLELAAAFGGQIWCRVPTDVKSAHEWRKVVVDDEAWARIVERFGGTRVHLPMGTRLQLRKVQILELSDEGLPPRQIAARIRVTERYVYRVLETVGKKAASSRTPRVEGRQRKLFED